MLHFSIIFLDSVTGYESHMYEYGFTLKLGPIITFVQ